MLLVDEMLHLLLAFQNNKFVQARKVGMRIRVNEAVKIGLKTFKDIKSHRNITVNNELTKDEIKIQQKSNKTA